jgi:hypothetical protein
MKNKLDIYKSMLILLFVFNILDAFITHHFVTKYSAYELNPIMNWLISVDPILFVVVKIVAGTLGVLVLWKTIAPSVASRVGTCVLFCVYSLLMLYYAFCIAYMAFVG